MKRRTKIVATLGPASDQPDSLEKLIRAGIDMVRVNFSHGSADDHRQRMQLVRDCAARAGREVGILADLQGPKIRVARFKNNKIHLDDGSEFILDAELDKDSGDEHTVGIDYKQLPQDVNAGDTLLLDDGRLRFEVKTVQGSKIVCTVINGGTLSNNKGINRLGGGLSAEALTDKDKADLKVAVAADADFIAISFPRDAQDIELAKTLIKEANGNCGVIAKIERAEAVVNIDEIIEAADGVMVARGDLAVEIGEAEVPGVQKHIINRARALYKPVITATQMMETMTTNTVPTRAEVSDVANAVLDQTDAVMLSAETAVGAHPSLVVATMARVCLSAEKFAQMNHDMPVTQNFERVDQAIAVSTMFTANHMRPTAIIALTESGSTALMMSRIRSDIPIYALSRDARSRGKMTMYRDVYPIRFEVTEIARREINLQAVNALENKGLVKKGDLVILTKGDAMGIHGGTNAMKILTVGEVN